VPDLLKLIKYFLGLELISTVPEDHKIQNAELFNENIENATVRFSDFRR